MSARDIISRAIAPISSDIYYAGHYWNDYRTVWRELERRMSGRPGLGYRDCFHEMLDGRRFERGLFLNCGDGHVERDFFRFGVVKSAVGVDISEDLLKKARSDAEGLPLEYVRMDANAGALPSGQFDLIVNNAAAHHIAYINRVFAALCRALTPDGYFVNNDYIGPHRNQYPFKQWAACAEVNRNLSRDARQELYYPHIPTMLVTDPSEAIHSELIRQTYLRYFTDEYYRPTGGAIAYPLITHNEALRKLPAEAQESAIAEIMLADLAYLQEYPDSTMFAFWFGRPKHEILRDTAQLRRWENEEVEREARASRNGGRYYPPTQMEAMLGPEGR